MGVVGSQRATIVVDMIEGQKQRIIFAAALTTTAVSGIRLISRALVAPTLRVFMRVAVFIFGGVVASVLSA